MWLNQIHYPFFWCTVWWTCNSHRSLLPVVWSEHASFPSLFEPQIHWRFWLATQISSPILTHGFSLQGRVLGSGEKHQVPQVILSLGKFRKQDAKLIGFHGWYALMSYLSYLKYLHFKGVWLPKPKSISVSECSIELGGIIREPPWCLEIAKSHIHYVIFHVTIGRQVT